MTATRAVVIGIGTGCRRDDGVGPEVASRIAVLRIPGVRVAISDGECTGLLDLWTGSDLAVVVDAVIGTPSRPGRVRRVDGQCLRGSSAVTSSHALGVAEAVRLGEVLGRLPGRLVIFAVDVERHDLGIGLSAPVAAAVPRLTAAICGELEPYARGRRRTARSYPSFGGPS
ncbi:hydrogenase maturation protease [Nocardia grenadensis]|uniref:hydrogenase maturation protease n=1 Tax=Nocardia grenadensis TaxID=931537 RepID=UPI0009FE38B8|nr:hydrogenase maturation protease [Nocardia grenadensis]